MKKLLLVSGVLIGATLVGRRCGRPDQTEDGVAARLGAWVEAHMKQMMERMPEESPPKLIMSTLPRLAEQNDRILELLREQNDLLRGADARPEPAELG